MKSRLNTSAWMAVAGITVLILILMLTSPNVLWTLLAVPFVLFLPGFGMTVIFFPGKSLGIPERLLLSIGLSVTFTALSGLILNWTPGGLQTRSLLILLTGTLALEVLVIFFIRRSGWKEAITFPVDINFNARQWVLMALAALVAVMAIRVAGTPTSQQGLEGYTLLWVQAADTPGTIRVGVESEEFAATKYQIKYEFNDVIREGPTLELKPGEIWESVGPLPAGAVAGKSFTVLLYRLDDPTKVYRRAIWWPETH